MGERKRAKPDSKPASFAFASYPEYHDCADKDIAWVKQRKQEMDNESPKTSEGGPKVMFPEKLHALLERMDQQSTPSIGWLKHGRAFKVFNKERFVKDVLPFVFHTMNEFGSFQRQISLYGFVRCTAQGPDQGAYYHECFLRNRPYLCCLLTRSRSTGHSKRRLLDPDTEPKFRRMKPIHRAAIASIAAQSATLTETPSNTVVSLAPDFAHLDPISRNMPPANLPRDMYATPSLAPWPGVFGTSEANRSIQINAAPLAMPPIPVPMVQAVSPSTEFLRALTDPTSRTPLTLTGSVPTAAGPSLSMPQVPSTTLEVIRAFIDQQPDPTALVPTIGTASIPTTQGSLHVAEAIQALMNQQSGSTTVAPISTVAAAAALPTATAPFPSHVFDALQALNQQSVLTASVPAAAVASPPMAPRPVPILQAIQALMNQQVGSTVAVPTVAAASIPMAPVPSPPMIEAIHALTTQAAGSTIPPTAAASIPLAHTTSTLPVYDAIRALLNQAAGTTAPSLSIGATALLSADTAAPSPISIHALRAIASHESGRSGASVPFTVPPGASHPWNEAAISASIDAMRAFIDSEAKTQSNPAVLVPMATTQQPSGSSLSSPSVESIRAMLENESTRQAAIRLLQDSLSFLQQYPHSTNNTLGESAPCQSSGYATAPQGQLLAGVGDLLQGMARSEIVQNLPCSQSSIPASVAFPQDSSPRYSFPGSSSVTFPANRVEFLGATQYSGQLPLGLRQEHSARTGYPQFAANSARSVSLPSSAAASDGAKSSGENVSDSSGTSMAGYLSGVDLDTTPTGTPGESSNEAKSNDSKNSGSSSNDSGSDSDKNQTRRSRHKGSSSSSSGGTARFLRDVDLEASSSSDSNSNKRHKKAYAM